MKVNGNGQAKILTKEELRRLFREGFTSPRDRALFAICLFTGCRISEALALKTTDIKAETITFRKSTTKGKLKTRTVDIDSFLYEFLSEYRPRRSLSGLLFPGRTPGQPLDRSTADKILKQACQSIGIEGASTHSFRRTALTQMSNGGVPLRIIQEISGHSDLGVLQRYLEVSPEQRRKAIAMIGF